MYRILHRTRLHPRPCGCTHGVSLPSQLVLTAYVHARTIHTCIRARPFSPRQFTPTQDTFLYNPVARALFSLYGDVIRNTYVTPKLIRYNFTGRLRSPLHLLSLLLRRAEPSDCRLGSPSYRCQPVSGATRSRNRIPKIFPTFP